MKKILFIILFFTFASAYAQEFKKLILTVQTNISKEAPIYIEPIDNDRLLLVSYLKGSLEANGFKIVSDRKEATYLIKVKYKHRSDTGCGGYVMKEMDGQIMDIKNNAETVATFTFTQGNFEGKCASDILSALARKLNEKAK